MQHGAGAIDDLAGIAGDRFELTDGSLGAAQKCLNPFQRAIESRNQVDGVGGGASERRCSVGQGPARCVPGRLGRGRAAA